MLNYTVHRNKDSAQWVTFIHGAGGSSSIWFKQIKSFSRFLIYCLSTFADMGSQKPPTRFVKQYLYF